MNKKVLILSALGFILICTAGCSTQKPQPEPLTGLAKQLADAAQTANVCTMKEFYRDWYMAMFPLSVGSQLPSGLDRAQMEKVSDQYLRAFNSVAEQHYTNGTGFNCTNVHDYEIELAIKEGFDLMQKIDYLVADPVHLSDRRARAAARDLHEFSSLPVSRWTVSQRNFVRWIELRDHWPPEQIGLTEKQQEDLDRTKPAESPVKIPEQGG